MWFGGVGMFFVFTVMPLTVFGIEILWNLGGMSTIAAETILAITVGEFALLMFLPVWTTHDMNRSRLRPIVLARVGRILILYANPVGLILISYRIFWREVLVPLSRLVTGLALMLFWLASPPSGKK